MNEGDLLLDLIPEVEDTVDQAPGTPGRNTYRPREFLRAARTMTKRIQSEIIDMDRGWFTDQTDIVVAADAVSFELPANTLGIVRIYEVDPTDGRGLRTIHKRTYQDIERNFGYIVQPHTRPVTIPFSIGRHDAMTIRVHYIYRPMPVVHGVCRDGGTDTIQFEKHELSRSGLFIGMELFLRDEELETGESRTLTSYDGPSRQAGISESTWDTTPVAGQTIYTVRLDLPWQGHSAWLFGVAAQLTTKLKNVSRPLSQQAAVALKEMKRSIRFANRTQPDRVRDDSGGPGHGDPVVHSARTGPGNWGGGG